MRLTEKLAVLADAAKYDTSCASSGGTKRGSRKTGGIGSNEGSGICHACASDGRCISLLKILLTNFCINRRSSNVRRARFSVDEVAQLMMDFYRRNYIEGLFLSSGIIQNSDYTMEMLTGSKSPGSRRHRRVHFDDLWRMYCASIFNPARLKVDAMVKEMPARGSAGGIAARDIQRPFLKLSQCKRFTRLFMGVYMAVSRSRAPERPRMQPTAPRLAGLASSLRSATRPTHDSVDGAFPQGIDSPDTYLRYLTAMLPLVQWLHHSWRPQWDEYSHWHDPLRLQHLRDDLACLGRSNAPVPPAIAGSVAEWLGGCYVVEGSALGARLLVRDLDRLQRRHPQLSGARSFLDAHIADPRRWARFRDTLDALPDSCSSAALRGARRGFALVHIQIQAMEANA